MTKPEHDPTSIGNLSVIFRGIAETDVQLALELQARQPGLMLAEALVFLGALRDEDARWLLRKQNAMRTSPTLEDVNQVLDYACDLTERTTGSLQEFRLLLKR